MAARVRFRAAAAGAFGLTVVFVAWANQSWGGDRATALFSDFVSTLVPLLAALACLHRAKESAALSSAWTWLAAGCTAWAAGQAYWTVFEFSHGTPPATPSYADIGYLAFIPCAVWGLLRFVELRGQPTGYLRVGLDGIIAGASFIFIAFVFGLERILLDSGKPDLPLVVNLLYPFGDAVLLGVVMVRLTRAPPSARRSLGLLALGMVSLIVADTWFVVVDAQGLYTTGGVLDAAWIVGFLLIGLAALRPDGLARQMDPPVQTALLVTLPLVPFILAAVVAGYAQVRDGALSVTLFWSAVAVVLIVVARLMVMLLDNVILTRKAQAAADTLRAEQAYRTKMLNAITHDLMSPLSPVTLQLRILESPKLSMDGQVAHGLDVVRRNMKQVVHLATDLKDLANLQAGHFRMDLADTDLAAIAQHSLDSFAQSATERGIELRGEIAGPLPLHADAARLTQVIYNLVSNALKFTPTGKAVVLRLHRNGAAAVMAVSDEGRGLASDEQQRLFQPFSQVHDRAEQAPADRGSGLGLYIAKQIVEQHGGHIAVASLGLGRGSTFTVELPMLGRDA